MRVSAWGLDTNSSRGRETVVAKEELRLSLRLALLERLPSSSQVFLKACV